eukprot:scaffold93792_cov18-Prasinocladus_malaysianus.AAC.1
MHAAHKHSRSLVAPYSYGSTVVRLLPRVCLTAPYCTVPYRSMETGWRIRKTRMLLVRTTVATTSDYRVGRKFLKRK